MVLPFLLFGIHPGFFLGKQKKPINHLRSDCIVVGFIFSLFVSVPRSMVLEGIPHSLRPHIWLRLSGAASKRAHSAPSSASGAAAAASSSADDGAVTYKQVVKASASDQLMTSKQVSRRKGLAGAVTC